MTMDVGESPSNAPGAPLWMVSLGSKRSRPLFPFLRFGFPSMLLKTKKGTLLIVRLLWGHPKAEP